MITVTRALQVVAFVIATAVVVIQFVGPARSNPVTNSARAVEAHLQVRPEVSAILERSCVDCHSNNTRWPWYSAVAPVSWFVIDHVNDGRKHLNFSDWGRYSARESEQMLGEVCKEVKSGAMPLASYTAIHRNAVLSGSDVRTLCEWANTEQRSVKR